MEYKLYMDGFEIVNDEDLMMGDMVTGKVISISELPPNESVEANSRAFVQNSKNSRRSSESTASADSSASATFCDERKADSPKGK